MRLPTTIRCQRCQLTRPNFCQLEGGSQGILARLGQEAVINGYDGSGSIESFSSCH